MSKFGSTTLWIVLLGLLAFGVTHYSSKQSILFLGNLTETTVDTVGAYYTLDTVTGQGAGSLVRYQFSLVPGFDTLPVPDSAVRLDIPGQYDKNTSYFLEFQVD